MPSEILGQALSAVLSPAFFAALLVCAFGYRISARWTFWQKRRELSLAAANQFYALYGEFFAIWKLWNYWVRQNSTDEAARRALFDRAASCESGFEALVIKVASERSLSPKDVRTLGCFRQGMQTLRQRIRDKVELGWNRGDHPDYVAFKSLATAVARIASNVDLGRPPNEKAAREQLLSITSNKWEEEWAAGLAQPA